MISLILATGKGGKKPKKGTIVSFSLSPFFPRSLGRSRFVFLLTFERKNQFLLHITIPPSTCSTWPVT
jgi:hypothetical protein